MPFDGIPSRRFSWRDVPDLMDRLTTAQNHAAFAHQDILTFAGFMDNRAGLERHVVKCEARAAEYKPTGRRRARRTA
jgi:hypothetical protein